MHILMGLETGQSVCLCLAALVTEIKWGSLSPNSDKRVYLCYK